MNSKVYLLPNLLGTDADLNRSFPPINKEIIQSLNCFAVENLKDARRFLVKMGLKAKIDESEFFLLNKKSTSEDIYLILEQLKNGNSVGILSDAGCPGIADPGPLLVELAHKHKYGVVPLIGPSSILLALMGSGFNGQSFTFNGYLHREPLKRSKEIKILEGRLNSQNQTQIFMETPYRNNALLADLLKILHSDTKLCIAANISLSNEFIKTKKTKDWKKSIPDINKQPAIFLIGQ